MTKLTFTQANKNSFSPVKLSFNVPVELAFSSPYESPTSPITMLFDGVPIVRPEEPLEIGMYTTFTFKNAKSLIEKKYNTAWTFGKALSCNFALAWSFKNVGVLSKISYQNYTQLLKKQFNLRYKNTDLIGIETTLSFTVPVLINDYVNTSWQNQKPLLTTQTTYAFDQCDLYSTSKQIAWKKPQDLTRELNLNWQDDNAVLPNYLRLSYGFEPYEIVCRWAQKPKDGLVIIEFDSTPNQTNSPLNMVLNDNGKVCELVRNEWFLRAQDEYPVIDINLPIEPQLQSSYIMEPSLVCIRVSDSLEILISSFTYQVSRSQYAAAVSIKFSSRIDYERSINELLKVTLNGYEFYVLVGAATRAFAFASKSYSATGKSRIAELDQPNARATSYTNENGRSFLGLATDILQNTGWTVLSEIIDYNVPAFALSYQELTPVEALKYLADSIGAMLITDDLAQTVTFVPVWPVMPWATDDATPDVIINESLILSHNSTDIISPLHNVVMVRGEQSGVQCKVKLNNTLADQYAADVTNALMTTEQAARQRGSYVLANAGDKEQSDIRTKIMPDLPPIKPGMLLGIQYSDSVYKATCDSATYSAATDAQGRLTVNQTFTVLKRTV